MTIGMNNSCSVNLIFFIGSFVNDFQHAKYHKIIPETLEKKFFINMIVYFFFESFSSL